MERMGGKNAEKEGEKEEKRVQEVKGIRRKESVGSRRYKKQKV